MHSYLHKKTNIILKALALSFVLFITTNASALVLTPDFEVQIFPNVGAAGVAVSFDNVYANPVPVCTYVLADVNDDPATVRIDNLGMTGMTVYLQGTAGATLVPGNVHCVIMDEGDYTVAADGFEAEARFVDSNETNGNGDFVDLTQTEDVTADITGNYANPVVIGQVVTSNDPAFSTFWSHNCDARQTPTFEGAGDVCVGKQSSFIPNVSPAVATETIGYIVFEEAVGFLNGVRFETERGADIIRGVDNPLTSYGLDLAVDYSFAVASQSAEDGGNGGWAVLRGLGALDGGMLDLAIDEASTGSRAHTLEQVDYIAFAAAELTLEKTVINDDGGSLADTAFTLTADGPTIDVGSGDGTATSTSQISRSGVEGDSSITDEIIYPDTYSLSEVAIAGYTAGTWSCTEGTLTGSDLDLDPGDDAVCTITNDDDPAELTIIKIVINDQGGLAEVDDFTVQTDAGDLTFDSGTTVGDTTTYTSNTLTVDADTYRFREQDLSGYTEGSWSCTGNAGAVVGTFSNGSVEVANGEDVTCSITNDDIPARLTIVKTITNDNGGNITDPDLFLLTIDGVSVSSGVETTVSANTDLAINETLLTGYAFESMTGTDCPAALGGTINLESGTSATCTIVNNDVPASLTIVKEVVNDNGGTATITDFGVATGAATLTFDGGTTSGATTTYTATTLTVDADTYSLGELDVVGYTEGSWTCTGAAGTVVGTFNAGSVEVALGEDVTCSITNDDIVSQIILVKQVNNSANGGSAVADDWTLEANIGGGPAEVSGTSGVSQSINAGDYVLSEINGPSGYIMTDLACDDGTLTGDTLTVDVGEDITCTFTNRDLITDVEIIKTVSDLNPETGDTITFTLEISNNGPDDATNIVVDDIVLAGFSFVAGSMTGGDTRNQTAPNLQWVINTLSNGSSVLLEYQADVN